MGITVMPGLTSMESDTLTQQISTTIGQARLNGRFYRHPDSALASYPVAVDNALGALPDRHYSIAIVGGGAAGIASLYELSRLAKTLTAGTMTVTLYESDPNSFLTRHDVGTEAVNVQGLKAGRVSAARVNRNDTVYEVGAMRFPEIAGLTWHYASVVYGDSAPIKVFPNPGKVPTEFMFGDRIDRYSGADWLDPESPTRKVLLVVVNGLVGSSQTPIAQFPIGGRDPVQVTELLKSETTSPAQLRAIQETDWPAFIAAHDGTTLEAAVRRIVTREIGKGAASSLPPIDGLDQAEAINYYVELFGRFGFGTGGFKPLFNISLVEMMRLILWDYSNEYTLPVEENVEFIAGLYQQALKMGSTRLKVDVRRARVSDVCHAESTRLPHVVSYDPAGTVSAQSYDYVILAAPQDQLALAVSRSGYSAKGVRLELGDSALGLGTVSLPNVVPALLLSNTSSAPNARIVTALNQLHMVRSSKVFGTIETAKLDEPFVPTLKGQAIKAVVSDSGLAASYVVPSPTGPGTPRYSSFLASYTWGDDSTRLQHNFGAYPQNPPTSDGTASAMFKTMINRATRNVLDPDPDHPTAAPSVWWFSRLLSMVREEDRFVFDWTTNGTAGGFKLDGTGDHHQSNLCFRYHTHALNPRLGNRFFLASDSYSHLGGWLEGAFMSAINAIAGLVVAANGGNAGALRDAARDVVTGLRPIAP